jgi:hypothetical protein
MTASTSELLNLARTLPIPVPWDRDVFIARVAEIRGRPITLIPTDTAALTDSPCGLWLARKDDDLILHEIGTSEYHIDQIVCHEIGHMVLGHRAPAKQQQGEPAARDRAAAIRAVLPDLDPSAIHSILGRSHYDSVQERDAEMFANTLMIAAAEAADQQSVMRGVFFRQR